jgi:site-specific DNA recombinase
MLEFGQKGHELKDAVIYARVSSQAQVKAGMGVESQATYCTQYANWKGYAIHGIFRDFGISGSRADRTGILQMLAFLKENPKTRYVVIVDDISRLARDIRVHLDLRDAIAKCGAVLESPSVTFGTDSDSRFFENMQALNAQHHREKNAEQTKKRQQARLINGYWPFPAALGYRHERKPGHGKVMVPHQPLAGIIQEGLEGYASGRFQSQMEVARFFQSQPDFPKTRFGSVTCEAANRILTRVLYAGHVECEPWQIALRKGQHEGLITLETFQRIQRRLQGSANVPARPDISADFPLRGFVLCECEKPLTSCWSKSKTGAKHPYYLCFNRDCTQFRKSIPRAVLEDDFEDLLKTIQPSESLFELTKAMFCKAWELQSERSATLRDSIKRRVAEIEKKTATLLERIIDASSANVIATYEKHISELETEKLVMTEKLQKAGKPRRSFDEMFELAINFLSNPQKLWDSRLLTDKRIVLKLAFNERLVYQRNSGFRTPVISSVFKALQGISTLNFQMAERERFELSVGYKPTQTFQVIRPSGLHLLALCDSSPLSSRRASYRVDELMTKFTPKAEFVQAPFDTMLVS